ncbi:MAG: DUF1501 domain-containing protein [Methylococcus sp.]|nr:DUF1501 domain-containing protein [Methylococcus sp.]
MVSRRQFLQHSGQALGAAAMLSGLGRIAPAAAASDYKALVCIFLAGGNDGNNTVIPYDDYAAYQAVRSTAGLLNIPQAQLLQIAAPSQRNKAFGLHPSLAELQRLYAAGKLAVLANAGTLARPVTKTELLNGGPRPENLFSHSDQQAQWQAATAATVTDSSPTGWGGRLADGLGYAYNPGANLPMIASLAGVTLFSTGRSTSPIVPGSSLLGFNNSKTAATCDALRKLQGMDLGLTLVKAKSGLTASAIDASNVLNSALKSAPALATVFPSTSLGNQLKTAASIIGARSQLGLNRQIFFCSLGGFDTHNGQPGTQGNLFVQLSQAMKAFYDATAELGVEANVTAFTLSDFGRAFMPNAGQGSDHAWGSHHLIMGGAVNGRNIYGRFPSLSLQGPDDLTGEGRWIPTTAVDEYAAKLAHWFGAADLAAAFPNLDNFDATRTDLSFMKAG